MVARRKSGKPKATVILAPNAKGKKSRQVSLSIPILVLLLSFLLIAFGASVFYFTKAVRNSAKLLHYRYLQVENEKLAKDINIFVAKTKVLEKGITELERREQDLRMMLGITEQDYKKKDNF